MKDTYHNLEEDLKATQTVLQTMYIDEIMTKERRVRAEVLKVASLREKEERQKSRIDWLQVGDSNTSFFHKVITYRRARKE